VRNRAFLVIAVLWLLTLSGCGSAGTEEVQGMTETLVRTAASTQGQAELAKVGVEVSGPLSCTSTRDGDVINLTCNGTALDGRQVSVTGAATSLPGGTTVAGHFVGTADQQQVFALDCLGC
jgi:hypothetical protein